MKNTPEVSRSEDAPSRKLEQQLCFALYSASLAMTKLYQSHLKLLGLTYPQYVVMLALWEKDGVTVSEVGRCVQLESGTLSQLLKRLEQAGFISRVRDTGNDERRVIIRLTEAGRELERLAAGVPAAMTGEIGIKFETLAGLRDGAKHVQEKLSRRYRAGEMISRDVLTLFQVSSLLNRSALTSAPDWPSGLPEGFFLKRYLLS